jgi:zinc/manganese transport system substrate-binding protein
MANVSKPWLGGLMAAALIALAFSSPVNGAAGKIEVLAAENFYGDIAQQIGGERVAVTSILSNPDQDPHLFEISPTIVRQIAAAKIVVYSGADYDPWMDKLLKGTDRPGRMTIVAANLVNKKPGDNPHVWYDPATMPAVARALSAALGGVDPPHKAEYAERLQVFLASLDPLNEKIAAIRSKFAGAPVAATEPVFGYMAAALGLAMHDQRFQLAIMNDTEPSARDLAAFEQDLALHRVRVMFYNKQASNKIVQHLVAYARASNIPVVGVTETAPPGLSYRDWMLSELAETEKALAQPSS